MHARTRIVRLSVAALPICLFLASTGVKALGASGKAAAVVATLHSFGNAGDGFQPHGAPVLGSGGILYGTTYRGGAYGLGTVYSLTPPTVQGGQWTESVLYSFGAIGDASGPTAGLAIGPRGGLYGTTLSGGANDKGAVFLLTPPATSGAPWTESILWSFGSGMDGQGPAAGVIGAAGALYGATIGGGTSNLGVVYSLSAPTGAGMPWTETILHNFAGGSADGSSPSSGVALGSGAVLYGVTDQGGSDNMGTAYSLTPPSTPGNPWTETLLYTFHGNDGFYPSGGLLVGPTGVLYGTANGEGGVGGVFTLSPPSWAHAVIRSFTVKQGSQPSALVLSTNGSLYGTTYQGGTQDLGTVFQLKPPKSTGLWTEKVLGSFVSGGGSGNFPAGLIAGPGGVFYGIATEGGSYNGGVLFSVTP